MASVVINGDTSGAVTISAPAVAGTTTLTLPTTSGTVLTTATSTGISGSAISSGTVPEAYGGTGTSTGYYGFKNRIINGAMAIAQYGGTATVNAASNTYAVDRTFGTGTGSSGVFTMAQSSTAPTGFSNSLLITVTTADASLSASDLYLLGQNIEGFNTSDLNWGTANASTITLSFWVRSSVTGTYGGSFSNSGVTRSYPFTYTISVANTFEYKTITIAGDTSGTWIGATNGVGLRLFLGLGAGSTFSGTAGAWASADYRSATSVTNLMATVSATFYITGVQLEKGSTATSFDYRPYSTELALAQRYYFQYAAASADGQEAVARTALTSFDLTTYLPVTMRSAPTLILPSGSTYGRLVGHDTSGAATAQNVTAMSVQASNQSLSAIHLAGGNNSMTYAQGQLSTSFDTNSNSAGLGLSAEL
jgi:hypothetical protein